MATIADATRLTRQGRLAEATALIQRNLGIARGARPGLLDDDTVDSGPAVATPGTRPLQAPSGWRSRRGATIGVPTSAALRRAARGARDVEHGSPGGAFLARSYTNRAGTRAYRLYVPTGYRGQSLPLVVMLHGGTQGAADFATATGMNALAERHVFLVVYPEQARSANAMGYWNWFQPGDQVRDAGEPSLIAGITRRIMSTYAVDAGGVGIAGFSAGGAMAAVMAATYPDLYAAVAVHSGLPFGAAHDVRSAYAAMRTGPPRSTGRLGRAVPLIVFHGDRDPVVSPVNGDRLVGEALRTAGPATVKSSSRGQVRDGHAYTRTVYTGADGAALIEQWIVHQAGHAWSGGKANGSYTDPRGPDASAELIRFFGGHITGRGENHTPGPETEPAERW